MSSQKLTSQFSAASGSLKCNGAGMRERVKRIGGTLALKSQAGVGTELTLQVPRKGSANADGGPQV